MIRRHRLIEQFLVQTLSMNWDEVHDEAELKRIAHHEDALIGINNRNLKTFEVDLDNSVRLRKLFKEENIFIAESGIKSREDMNYLKLNDIRVFLIGESLMRGDFFKI